MFSLPKTPHFDGRRILLGDTPSVSSTMSDQAATNGTAARTALNGNEEDGTSVEKMKAVRNFARPSRRDWGEVVSEL